MQGFVWIEHHPAEVRLASKTRSLSDIAALEAGAFGVAVGRDVGRVQELLMAQPVEGELAIYG
jgi:hypothetical protein